MPRIMTISPRFAVAGALVPEDFAAIARMGFHAVLSNRPDGEEAGQLTAEQEARLAAAAGLVYRHVPATKLDVLSQGVIEGMADALSDVDGPVLAHCKSGMRSAIIWAATQVAAHGVEPTLQRVRAAGFDLDAVREELEEFAVQAPAAAAA
jgi:uncharacterized protein (TIGR01244 family)